MSAPALARTASERARNDALTRLEGSSTPEPRSASREGSPFLQGPPPRLSMLQRRHLEQMQQKQQAEADELEGSPTFSVFTPSVIAPAQPVLPPAASPNADRQAAGSFLIRKLSKRDASSVNTSSPSTPVQRTLTKPIYDINNYQTANDAVEVIDTEPDSAATPTYATAHQPESSSVTPTSTSTDTSPSQYRFSSTTAASEFRPYRHTMERDRDSAYAKLLVEDQFEYETLLQQRAQQSSGLPAMSALPAQPGQAHSAFPPPSEQYRFPTPPPHDGSELEDRELTRQLSVKVRYYSESECEHQADYANSRPTKHRRAYLDIC